MRDGIDQALKPVPAHRALGVHRRPRLVTLRLDLLLTPAVQQAWVRDRIALVGTVDIERQRAGRIEVEHIDAVLPEQRGGLL